MTRSLPWVSPLLLAAMLAAQDPPASPPTKSTAAARLDALRAEQKQLFADYQAEVKEIAAKAKAAAPGEAVPAMPMRPDLSPLVAKAQAAAADYAGTADAVSFLMLIVSSAGNDREAAAAALETLALRHLDHPATAELGPMLPMLGRVVGADMVPALLEQFAKSTNADVRGWALLGMHQSTIEKGERDGDAYKVARMELTKAAELAADERLRGEIQGAIDLREKLGVGSIAPDIVGEDLDGVTFKLSDYRGKVVFLDFWGDW